MAAKDVENICQPHARYSMLRDPEKVSCEVVLFFSPKMLCNKLVVYKTKLKPPPCAANFKHFFRCHLHSILIGWFRIVGVGRAFLLSAFSEYAVAHWLIMLQKYDVAQGPYMPTLYMQISIIIYLCRKDVFIRSDLDTKSKEIWIIGDF